MLLEKALYHLDRCTYSHEHVIKKGAFGLMKVLAVHPKKY